MMQTLIEHDGVVMLDPEFIPSAEARDLFVPLRQNLAWSQEHYTLFGKSVPSPRLVCWYGNADAVYSYSGVKHVPRPWLPLLLDLKVRVEAASGCVFNSVLGNLYRDGKDSMGWHADKEPELGPQPCIASLSFGAPRLFMLRHKASGDTHRVELGNGSLLVMAGSLQLHWRHCVPKTKAVIGPRINLTFRRILLAGAGPTE